MGDQPAPPGRDLPAGALDEAHRALDVSVGEVEAIEVEVDALRRKLAELESAEAAWREYVAASERVAAWNRRMEPHAALRDRRADVERQVITARLAVETERDQLVREIEELEAVTNRHAALYDRRAAVEEDRRTLTTGEARLVEHRQSREALASQVASLQQRVGSIVTAGRSARERLRLLDASVEHCALCEQVLDLATRAVLIERQQAEIDRLLGEHRSATNELERKRRELAEAQAQLAALERETATRRASLDREAAELKRAEQAAEAAGRRLVIALEELELVEDRLITGEYAPGLIDELTQLDRELLALGYDLADYREARETMLRLEPVQSREPDIVAVRAALTGAEARLANAESRAAGLGAEVRRLSEDVHGLRGP